MPAAFALRDAQLVVARSYGYESWPKLKAYVDGSTGKRLLDAVHANDTEEVARILRIRPELANAGNATKALHHAAVTRQHAMVRTLVLVWRAQGGDGILESLDRAWCHHEWDRSTYLTCFKMILDRCGPPTAQLESGTTVLHAVVAMGDHVRPEERAAFAAAALDAGAQMDVRDELLESTPLGWACRWGREELVRVFLERGADPVEADAAPWATPCAWAEKKGHRQRGCAATPRRRRPREVKIAAYRAASADASHM